MSGGARASQIPWYRLMIPGDKEPVMQLEGPSLPEVMRAHERSDGGWVERCEQLTVWTEWMPL